MKLFLLLVIFTSTLGLAYGAIGPAFTLEIEPPLKQHQSDIPVEDVRCRENLLLVVKANFDSSACVKPTTVEKLFERGWAYQEAPIIHEPNNENEIILTGNVDRIWSVEGLEFHLKPLDDDQNKINHTGFDTIILYATEETVSSFIRHIDDKKTQVKGVIVPDTHDAYKTNFSGLPIFQVQEITIHESEPSEPGKGNYPIDPAGIVNASNQFALDFYSKTSQNNNENIFFSPTSISTAFSILYEGARQNTAQEIQNVFGFPEDEQKRRHGYLSLHKSINEKGNTDTKLSIANALWLAENFEPLVKYIDTATTYYDSMVSTVDFVSDDGVNKINDWVDEKTQGKITELLKPGSTGSNTRMAITNAIYFKGLWEHPFDPEDTYEADFVISPEKTVKVQMMTYPHKMQMNIAFTEQMKMLELPYKNNTMSMLIILPNETDDLKSVEDSLTLENLENWKSMLSKRGSGTVIHLPKFSLETDYNLIKTLSDMGMPSAFSAGDADFSGITGSKRLYVSQAIHKAFVDVNEEGTEAAGATAIVLDESGGQVFKADHPFIFIIQDKKTDSILFVGRVMDPTS